MKLDAEWLLYPGVQRLFMLYHQQGFELFAVGGCVRNSLLSRAVADIDMSSNATPQQALEFLTEAGLRVIPTGIEHGTLTVISDGLPVEITTYRRDVETDGRRATVAFAKTMIEDAARRDFTINALYADANGVIIDPLGGLADIGGPQIRFIGEAETRIREDYLRSLRFFRFHAQYVGADQGFDPESLAAIAATQEGLTKLSRERIGAELSKLLTVPDPSFAMAGMGQSGVLAQILPGAELRALAPLVHIEQELGLDPDWTRRLAAICGLETATTLRLKKTELRRHQTLREAAQSTQTPGELGYRLKEDAINAYALRCAFLETMPLLWDINALQDGSCAVFPIKPADLMPEFSGPALGKKLRDLEAEWIASGFSKTKSELCP
jgi:poly(A) polymerase